MRKALLLWTLIGWPLAAWGGDLVTLETVDGRTFRGEVLEANEREVVLAVRRGGAQATLRLPRSRLKGDPVAAQDPLARFAADLAAARSLEGSARADALVALAARVADEADPALAGPLYEEAGACDPERRDQTDVQAAHAYLAGGNEAKADAVLRAALERNPKNAGARAAARRLEEAFERKARTLVEPGVQAFLENRPRTALSKLTEAAEALPRRVLDQVSERVRARTGIGLAEMMVDCRLRAVCKTCEGAGVVPCPLQNANSNTRCRLGRRVHFGRIERVGRLKFNRWERCRRCNGRGHLTCKSCKGLGLYLSRPTAYEREALVKTLTGRLKGLEERANVLTRRVEDDDRESAVRSVAVTELLGLLQDVRTYAQALSNLDPRAGAEGGGGLRGVARASAQRAAAIMTALANALYVGGEQRYEKAVNYDSPLGDDAEFVSAGMRAVQAKQAYELVNQARLYMLEALDLDPRTLGPTRGDMKRRLELIDRFLARSWKTYLTLRALEEKTQDAELNVNALILNALRAAGGGSSDDEITGSGKSEGGVQTKSGSHARGKTSGDFKGKGQ
ncbi:MAG: hypothetical protein D6731_24665 [Planctomycetota bacterium]|nr:MAG: hypothetical protein D6731_24665 [Planctomycetota bacterium]